MIEFFTNLKFKALVFLVINSNKKLKPKSTKHIVYVVGLRLFIILFYSPKKSYD